MDFFKDFWSIWLINDCDWLMTAKDKSVWFFLSVHEIIFAREGLNERLFLILCFRFFSGDQIQQSSQQS